MSIFADHVLPFVAASYILTGCFNPQRELEEHPSVEATKAEHQIKLAKAEQQRAGAEELQSDKNQERARMVGTPKNGSNIALRLMISERIRGRAKSRWVGESIPLKANGSLNKFPPARTTPDAVADSNGALWMEFSDGDESSRIGLSASSVFSSGTDADLHTRVSARIGHVLKSPKHSRESMMEFRQDWKLLESAGAKPGPAQWQKRRRPLQGEAAASSPATNRQPTLSPAQLNSHLLQVYTFTSHHTLTCQI